MTKEEQLRALYNANGLEREDIHLLELGGKKIPIIKREGIEKIQAKNKMKINFDLVYHSPDCKTAIIKANGVCGEGEKFVSVETYGEVSPENYKNKTPYPIAMAEKRALSRCVLKLSGFYSLGVFGEDEADDFKPKN